MALRFKTSIFWCWKGDEKTMCIVGLTRVDEKRLFDFRDRLVSHFCGLRGLAVREERGVPTRYDSFAWLFDTKDMEEVERFYSGKRPTSLQAIFKTAAYRRWQEESDALDKRSKLEIATSHDLSGLIVYSSALSPEEISAAIRKVSGELGLGLREDPELQDINIFSNATLGVRQG